MSIRATMVRLLGGSMASAPRAAFQGNSIFVGDLSDPRIAEALRGGSMTSSGESVGPHNAMRVSVVQACVRLITRSTAMLPLQLMEEIAEGNVQKAKDHWLYPLLYVKPNRWQTSFEWRSMMQAHLLLRGNAYSYIVPGVGPKKILELIPLHPDRVEPKQQDDLSLIYEYTKKNGSKVTFKQHEILHLRDISLDGIKGLSVISQAREGIGIAMTAERAGATMFKKGTLAGGALMTDAALSDTAFNRLRVDMEEKRAGVEHAGEWLILEEGLEPKALGLSAVDLQFIETRKFQVEDIARIFGVPPHMIGSVDKTTSWGQGIENQTIGFVVFTLQPWLTIWEQAIIRDLVPEKDVGRIFPKHNLAALLRGSNKDRAEYISRALGAGGSPAWISQNEARALEDRNRMGDVDGEYDQLPKPTNTQAQKPSSERNENEPPQDS